ncbi:hypothetical protein HpHA286_11360 [Helicobacter pylori]
MAIIRLDSNNNNYCENKQDTNIGKALCKTLSSIILKYSIYEGSYIIDMHLIDD